ncbi:MAG: hypothetical protein ACTSYD_05695 [Candidatus Heimdallarchaeaceae archaeon]
MFRKSKKSSSEKANQELGRARIAAQQKRYDDAIAHAQKAIELLKDEGNRKSMDLAKALYYEFLGNKAIKEDRAIEAANYLGRAGGFYHRLGLAQELQRVYELQAKILLYIARNLMKERRFVEAASYFEQAAIAYQRLNRKAEELDCKAKSYVSRAAAEKTIAGRKVFLKKAVDLMEEKGSDEPLIKAQSAYYNALFVEDERPDLALQYYAEALQYFQLANATSRVEEIKRKMAELTK